MFEPTNEQGTVALFCSQLHVSGWEIVTIGSAFPDAVLMKNGEEWRVEFEFKARNFVDHGHDFSGCDLIICWQNDFADCPIPVIELRNHNWIAQNPQKGNYLMAQIEYWKGRAIRAEKQLKDIRISLDDKSDRGFIDGDVGKRLVLYYKDNPGAKLEDAAHHVGWSVPVVSKEVSSLVDMGVFHAEKHGRRKVITVNGNHEAYLAS